MDRRRRFNRTERAALYLAADGRCTECGADLEPGWHADHVTEWSRGGPTDVINGQALCPSCNLRKRPKTVTTKLRTWQEEALRSFFNTLPPDFLVSATPGAGKTALACTLARRAIDDDIVSQVIVVVPSDALRLQWADAAAQYGLKLQPITDGHYARRRSDDGIVVTYAQLVGAGGLQVRRECRHPTIAIIDEIHHAGDSKPWGDGLRTAIELAVHRIALTGTPWRRRPNERIPFVTYDCETGEVQVDHSYGYGQAVADGVCRAATFDAYEGEGRWIDCGLVVTANLGADLTDDQTGTMLDTIYRPDYRWVRSILTEANDALVETCVEVPDAAGLVVASSQDYANRYGAVLEQLTGRAPVVVTSDDKTSKDKIDAFRNSKDRWIVAVNMVSEGIDIPRLLVGVYASKARTPLFFRQVTGRLVRVRPGEHALARLFIPAVPVLMTHAKEIQDELHHQLEIEQEREKKERMLAERTMLGRESLSAGPATHDRTIYGGDEFSPETLAEAEQACERLGFRACDAPRVAALMHEMGQGAPPVEREPVMPEHRRIDILRADVETMARKVAFARAGLSGTKPDFKAVNTGLLRAGFPLRREASADQLEQMLSYLYQHLGETFDG